MKKRLILAGCFVAVTLCAWFWFVSHEQVHTALTIADIKQYEWNLNSCFRVELDSTLTLNMRAIKNDCFAAAVIQDIIERAALARFSDYDYSHAEQLYTLLYQPPFSPRLSIRNYRISCLLNLKQYNNAYALAALYNDDAERQRYEIGKLQSYYYPSRSFAESQDAVALQEHINDVCKEKDYCYILYGVSALLAGKELVKDTTTIYYQQKSMLNDSGYTALVQQDVTTTLEYYNVRVDSAQKKQLYRLIE
ncbi:MAG: hypothetical protein U0Y96_02385 [Candidatus Kapaibacterium sp.]|nr:hypothetical protein [Bacteroidota bacterium]